MPPENDANVTPENDAPKRPSKSDPKYDVPFDDSKIVKYGEANADVLRRKADTIAHIDGETRRLIAEMGQLMYAARGVGLAAPQIGKSVRLVVYDAGEGLCVLINPTLSKLRGEQFEPEEGCLSIPGLRGVVKRATEITVQAQDENGKAVKFRAVDFAARVIQHEVDHLNGILFIDHADPKTLRMLTPDEERAEQEGADEDVPPAE